MTIEELNQALTRAVNRIIELETINLKSVEGWLDLNTRLQNYEERIKTLEDARKAQISLNAELIDVSKSVATPKKTFWDLFKR